MGYKTLAEFLLDVTALYLKKLLESTGGNVHKAARLAGRNRTELYRLFKKLSIDPSEFRKERLPLREEGRGVEFGREDELPGPESSRDWVLDFGEIEKLLPNFRPED